MPAEVLNIRAVHPLLHLVSKQLATCWRWGGTSNDAPRGHARQLKYSRMLYQHMIQHHWVMDPQVQ